MKINDVEIDQDIQDKYPEPTCPSCGAGVNRPKCLFELNPSDCPRHGVRKEWVGRIVGAQREKQPASRVSSLPDTIVVDDRTVIHPYTMFDIVAAFLLKVSAEKEQQDV